MFLIVSIGFLVIFSSSWGFCSGFIRGVLLGFPGFCFLKSGYPKTKQAKRNKLPSRSGHPPNPKSKNKEIANRKISKKNKKLQNKTKKQTKTRKKINQTVFASTSPLLQGEDRLKHRSVGKWLKNLFVKTGSKERPVTGGVNYLVLLKVIWQWVKKVYLKNPIGK